MNTDLLRTFVVVAESGSLVDAAGKLHKSQSTVTKALQRFEAYVGGPLFDRSGYRLTLNPKGKLLLNSALSVLQSEKEFLDLSHSMYSHQNRELTVALDAIIPADTATNLLSTLLVQHSTPINIRIVSKILDGAYRLVERGDADFAITAMARESGELNSECVGQLEIVNIVASTYGDTYWKEIPQGVLSDDTETPLESNLLSVSPKVHVKSIELKCGLIKRGLAWGRVPKSMVEDDIRQGAVTVCPAPGVSTHMSIPIALVYSDHFDTSILNNI